jgi:CRP-like cAMP-binding protein
MPARHLTATEALASVPLFGALTQDELTRLAARVRQRSYPRGQIIFVEGDPGAALCVIVAGRVRIYLDDRAGREAVLNVYGPGEHFGELALLDGEPRSASAVAQEDCEVLWLERADFLEFLEAHPRAVPLLLATLSQRLRHTTRVVHDVAFRDVPARVARALLNLAESRGSPTPDGTHIEGRVTQVDLAAMVAATRESVNKCLASLQRRGVVKLDRGSITLRDLDALRERAEAP